MILGAFVVASCSDEIPSSKLENQNLALRSSSFLKSEDYGEFHNDLLGEFMASNYSEQQYDSFLELYDVLALINQSSENPLSEEEIDYYRALVVLHLGNENLTDSNYFDLTEHAIEECTSSRIQDDLLYLFRNSSPPNEVKEKIKLLMQRSDLDENDIEILTKFNSVCDASTIFWEDYASTNGTNQRSQSPCDPEDQKVIADIFGTIFGPLGTIDYSWLIHKIQKSRGGGCF